METRNARKRLAKTMLNLLPNLTPVAKNEQNAVQVSLQFEEGAPFVPSVIECMAKAAHAIIKQNPLAAAHYPFFDAAKAGDWFAGRPLGPNPVESNGFPPQKHLRLKAIKLGSEVLLEHAYRPDGRLGSTRYADGEMVGYDWDDLARTIRVRSRSGRDTLIKLRADDLVETATYDGVQRFHYEFDLNDRPGKLTYPDGVSSQRSFNQRDELSSATVGGIRTTFRWTPEGDFEGWTVQNSPNSHELKGNARSLAQVRDASDTVLARASYDAAGRLNTAFSDRVCLPTGGTVTRTFSQGRLTSLADERGSRAELIYGGKGQLTEIAVKTRCGHLWRYQYAPSGTLSSLEDPLKRAFGMSSDQHELMVKAVRPDHRAFSCKRDGLGILTECQVETGETWRTNFDGAGRLEGFSGPCNTRIKLGCVGTAPTMLQAPPPPRNFGLSSRSRQTWLTMPRLVGNPGAVTDRAATERSVPFWSLRRQTVKRIANGLIISNDAGEVTLLSSSHLRLGIEMCFG